LALATDLIIHFNDFRGSSAKNPAAVGAADISRTRRFRARHEGKQGWARGFAAHITSFTTQPAAALSDFARLAEQPLQDVLF